MTIEDVKRKLKRIEGMAFDPEGAHSYEDDLFVEFIAEVAEHGSGELQEMAHEVLKSTKIKFPRWYA